MDGLSGASGVLAVVSVAIQLGQGIHKLTLLLSSIKGASKDIKSMVEELEFLRTVLDEIRHNELNFGPHPATGNALKRCLQHLDALESIAGSLSPGFSSESSVKQVWTAMSAVRKNDKIRQLKSKILETKTTLLLAQQSSATRILNIQSQTLQDLMRLGGYSEKYPQSAEASSASSGSDILQELSSEIRRVSNVWPSHQLQQKLEQELSRSIQATVASVLQDQQLQYSRESSQILALAGISSSKSGIGWTQLKYVNTTQTFLGRIYCSVSINPRMNGRVTFNFVPSWMMIKLGFSKTVLVEPFAIYAYGWQRALRTFNLVPNDSLLFQFCRNGNLEAVRLLISEGKASVRDINSKGETALHIAASRCHTNLCSFLLNNGAETEVKTFQGFERTPFLCACYPSDENEDGSISGYEVSYRDLVDTCRLFISAGEDLEVLTGPDMSRVALFSTSDILKDEEALSKSLWLFDFAMSKNLSSSFNETWWKWSVGYILRGSLGPEEVSRILRYCNTSIIRWGLCERIQDMYCVSELNDKQVGNFLLLLSRTDGLKFIHTDRWGKNGSPVSIALRLSSSFVVFRSLLTKSGCDINEVIRDEIDLQDTGWTEKTLQKLFMSDITPFVAKGLFACQECHIDVSSLTGRGKEVPWERMLQRLKDEVDVNAPLTDDELREQEEWQGYAKADKEGICQQCHGKKNQVIDDEEDDDFCPYLFCI